MTRLLIAVALGAVVGCTGPPASSRSTAEAKTATATIRSEAEAIKQEHPAAAPRANTIVAQTKVVDRSVADVEKGLAAVKVALQKEKDASKRLFRCLLAWAGVASTAGIALSIAVALWFRSKPAVFSAVGFTAMTLLCVGLTVAFDYLGWAAIAMLGIGAAGLGFWVWRDDRRSASTGSDSS